MGNQATKAQPERVRLMKTVLKALAGTSIALLVFAAMGYYAMVLEGKAYKEAAIEFWGDQHDPNAADKAYWGWLGELYMPTGGPMIAPKHAGVCPDTELPLVPFRTNGDGGFKVLCGMGTDTTVEVLKTEEIPDQKFRDALLEAMDKRGDEPR